MNTHHRHSRLRLRGALLALLLAACGLVAVAQPCVCTDCPEPIPATSTVTVCYEVGGLANAALGANGQGVCAARVEFAHDYIENLSITLRSPAGQTVQLVGPGFTGVSTLATAGARWDLEFRDCGESVSPVPGTGPRFSGDNTVWQVFGNYTGSYYPFADCLGDFDAGAANGEWCLDIVSSAVITNNDALLDFQVEFCDESGPGCCYAEAPTWVSAPADTTLCAGDAALELAFELDDDAGQGYTQRVLVSRNDSVFAYTSNALDLRGAPAGAYRLCGLEYFVGDANVLPAPGVPTAALVDSLAAGAFCAAYATDCREVVVVARPDTLRLDAAICVGDSVLFDGTYRFASGDYAASYTSVGGCDSTVTLELVVSARDTSRFRENLCAGDTLDFGGRSITAGGNYVYALTNAAGCDSTVLLEVVEFPSYEVSSDTAFCAGGQVVLGSVAVRSPGAFRQNEQTADGCDSTIVWEVYELTSAATLTASRLTLSCAQPNATLSANTPANAAAVRFERTWTGPTGPLGADVAIEVGEPGWYYLEHRASAGGVTCVSVDSVRIEADPRRATVSLPDTLILTCAVDSVTLIATTGNAAAYRFDWLGPPTTPRSDSSVAAGLPGDYAVAVERLDNGCRDTAYVHVAEERTSPSFVLPPPDTLTCTRDSVRLGVTGVQPAGALVAWTDAQGTPLTTGPGGEVSVSAAGLYYVRVEDQATGCTATDSVLVVSDTTGLRLRVESSDTLTCARDSVRVLLQASEPASVEWRFGGSPLGITGLDARLAEAGNYEVRATSLATGCTVTERFAVAADTTRPVARIEEPDTLRCFPPVGVLDARGSTGAHGLAFEWRTGSPDVLAGRLTPLLRTAGGGAYTVVVRDEVNGCIDSASVVLFEERTPPIADAGPDRQIDCSNNVASLGGGASTTGADIDYRWAALSGGLVGFPDGPRATASTGGTFVLTVRDLGTGCSARDTVSVSVAQGVPAVVVPDTMMLPCGVAATTLSGVGSASGDDFVYAWTTNGGTILAGADALDVQIQGPGYYRLTVTDTTSACAAFAETVVIETCPAAVVTASPDTIDCRTGPTIRLVATGTDGPGNVVRWTSADGTIVADADSLRPLVRGAGRYYVEVTQTFSAATARDSVEVVLDTVAPRVTAQGDLLLSCDDVSACVSLVGSGTSADALSYAWRTIGGQFCGLDTASAEVRVNAPGFYEVVATQARNGCSAAASLVVEVAPGVPVPDGGPNVVLACEQDTARLLAERPTPDTARTWWWTDRVGNVLTELQRLEVAVAEPGAYAFVVADSSSGCTAADTVFVVEQRCAPNARPVASGPITCATDSVTLSTPQQADMSARWERAVDRRVVGDDFEVSIGEPGDYIAFVTDADGQVDSARVTVRDWRTPPVARTLTPAVLTCRDTSVRLDARQSSDPLGGVLDFAWTGPHGGSTQPGAQLAVSEAGAYEVVVTSQLTGCSDTAVVSVQRDTLAPTARARALGRLDCANDEVRLDAGASQGQGSLSYTWTSLASPQVSLPATEQLNVDAVGDYALSVVDAVNGCIGVDTVAVTSFLLSDLGAPDSLTLPCVGGDVLLEVAGVPADVAVSWTTSAVGACLSAPDQATTAASCAGVYGWSATDTVGGCAYTGEVRVGRRAAGFALSVTGPSLLTCERQEVTLAASADTSGLDYVWSGVASGFGESLTVRDTGQVQLVARDTEGCTDSVLLTVGIDTLAPRVRLLGEDTLNCRRDELLVQVAGQAGRRYGYAWRWSGSGAADTLEALRVREAGSYEVRVRDEANGCAVTLSQNVVLDTATARVALDAPAGQQLSCSVAELPVEAEVTPGDAAVLWRGPAGQAFSQGALRQNLGQGGVYQVNVTHPRSGCVTSTAIVLTDVSAPVTGYRLAVTGGQLGCTADAVTLEASLAPGLRVEWVDAAGEAVDPDRVTTPGTFVARVVEEATGCRAVDSVAVTQYVPAFTLGGEARDTLTCETDQVTLWALTSGPTPAGLLYRYTSPNGDAVAGPADSLRVGVGGAWTVTTTEPGRGCTQETTVEVPVSAEAISNVVLEVTDATCAGERDGAIEVLAVEGGDGRFSYVIDDGPEQGVGQFGLLAAGSYAVRVSDGAGCDFVREVTVAGAELKELELRVPEALVLGDTTCVELVSVGGVPDRIRWSGPGIVGCDSCATVCVRLGEAQDLEATVTFEGCEVSTSVTLRAPDSAPAVWPTAFSPNGDGNNDRWLPRAVSGELLSARVYDRWGSLVFSTTGVDGVLANGWDGRVDGRALQPAVFAVQVTGRTVAGRVYVLYGDLTLLR